MKDSITFRWLGTAGAEFKYEGQTVLLDPYFSRVPDRTTPIQPDWNHIHRYISSAEFIVVSHSHFDHLADVPTIAKHTGAKVVGSETTLNVCRAFDVPEQQLLLAPPHRTIQLGGMSVTMLPSIHGTNPQGVIPNQGTFASPPSPPPLLANDYKEGGTFAPYLQFGDHRILQLGSANFIEQELTGKSVEVLLVCIAWREKVPDFTARLIQATRPKLVVPIHYDDFWLPIEQGCVVREDTSLEEFAGELNAVSPETRLISTDFFEWITME